MQYLAPGMRLYFITRTRKIPGIRACATSSSKEDALVLVSCAGSTPAHEERTKLFSLSEVVLFRVAVIRVGPHVVSAPRM